MAVALDVIGTEVFHASAVSPRTYTGLTTGLSLTNGAVAFVVCYDTHVTGTAATWDGVACTLLASANSLGTFGRAEVWGLSPIGAHTGNKTFSVSWTGGTSAITMVAGVSFTGVNQTGGTTSFPNGNSATGTSAASGSFNAAVNITVNTGDIGIAGFTTDQNNFTSVAGTQIFRDTGSNINGAGSLGTGSGVTAFTATATASLANNWTAVGVDILAAAGAAITSGGGPVESPVKFTRKTIYQTLAFVPVVTTPTLTWNAWTDWPDFAPKARSTSDYQPGFFIEPPPQVFFPYDRWADTAPGLKRSVEFPAVAFVAPQVPWTQWLQWPEIVPFRAKPTVDFRPWSFIPPPAQVFYPFDRWPDSALPFKRVAQNQDWSYGTFVTPTPAITWNAWTQWPDFLLRAKSVPDFIPWTFIAPAPQVWYPHDTWPDKVYGKPRAADFPFIAFPAQTPPQVWFPYDRWQDAHLRAKRSSEFPEPALVQVVIPSFIWSATGFWPDFATKAKPLVDILPWRFIEPPPQVWFPTADRWPDYLRKKQPPLNYDPLTLTQTVKTPWNTMTVWPDFAPIRGPKGLHPALQQFLARFPGTITLAPATVTISAVEVNSDGIIMAIQVFTSNPAARAIVSVQEIGMLSIVSIQEIGP